MESAFILSSGFFFSSFFMKSMAWWDIVEGKSKASVFTSFIFFIVYLRLMW